MSEARSIDPKRFIVAVLVGELVPIVVLVAIIAAAGPTDPAEAEAFAGRMGTWVGPIGGAITIFVLSAWAGARSRLPVLQGTLIGLTLAVVDVLILAATDSGFAWLFVTSNAGKVAAGACGGWLAARSAR